MSGGKFYFEGLNLKSKHLIKETKDFIRKSGDAKTNRKQKKKVIFQLGWCFFLKGETLVTEKLANAIILISKKLEFWHVRDYWEGQIWIWISGQG